MLLDMAPGSQAPAASFQHRCRVTAALLLIICVTLTKSAPTTYDEIEAKRTDLAEYLNDPNGCYYNYQHYEEGDRIVTNEPCLNCTCHNRMLMCYLRVCPFSKAIGQDCTVQKTPDQCCPTISCPEVPVHLLTSSTTQPTTTTTTTTTIGWHDSSYGCLMDENEFFPDGAQVPIDPWKPCELCYCIRNRTACVIQECTLHVEGCRPVYHDGVCCPVRYDCDYEIEKSTTTTPQISGGLVFSTTSAPSDCRVNDEVYTDGESISMNSDKPCEHCYCMRGDIVCVVQDCGEPLRGKDCTPETPPAGQCCPTSYQCANETTTDSYSITTLQPASQSDSDEHEAQKFPSQNDAFDKLGEKLPGSEQDDTNDIPDSEHVYTTPAATNDEILPVGISDQTSDTNEETSDSAAGSADAAVEGTTVLPTDDSTNQINGQNQQDISVIKPDSPNSISPVSGTESDPTKVESTDKPVESTSSVDGVQQTQSSAADPSVNENAVSPTASSTSDENNAVPANDGNGQNESPVENPASPTASTTSDENNAVPANDGNGQNESPVENPVSPTASTTSDENNAVPENDGNGQNESPVENPSQGDIESNSPVATTENDAVESETQSSNIQEKPQEETQQQTDAPSAIEKEPTKSSINEQTPAQNSDVKPQSEITSDKIQEPPKQSDTDSNESLNKIQTNVPSSDDVEQTTQQLTQKGTENTPLEETNAQTNKPTNIDQDSPNLTTQTSQNDNSVTESSSNAGPNAQNNDNAQEGNVSPTEIPKVGNEPAEQNQLPVENKPISENQPEAENASTEQNQDSSQVENASQTEIPDAQNEPTEQNKIQEESKPQIENKPESEIIPTEQNQDSPQAENVSPTELPNAENQNKLQEENITPTGLPGVENQDGTQEANVSPTNVPKVENEPTEQNKPIVEVDPQTGNQPEITPAEQNQDSTQGENVSPTELPKVEDQNKPQAESASPTEIPKVENESNEQNKPLESDNSQTGNQPESDATATEPNSQDNPHSGNEFSTEIPKVENEPVEQNKPLLTEGVQGSENQPESGNKPVEQNQDGPQVENTSSTDIPKVENEPTEQSKPLVEAVTEQNKQDSPQSQNVSPTEIPKVENDNAEQNNPTVNDHKPQAENQPESENTSTENINQDSPQLENESPTEIPKVENEPTEQNKPSIENGSPVTENQSEWNKTPTEPNKQDSPQIENVSPTDKPKVENEPVEQNKPTPVESGSQSEDKPESQNTPTENNEESPQINIVSPTDVPKVEDGPAEQNKPLVESPQSANQPESQNTPTEKNQDKPQAENVSPTEIPKVENEPVEQNKPLVDSDPQAENQPESQKEPAVQNQDNAQVENVSPTDIPTKLSEPQSENVSPINQDTPVVSENDVPTEQPINDNNIFIVTSTSPPLTSQNQVKDKEPTSALNKNTNSETEKVEDKATEKPQLTADDKISSVENVNKDIVSPAVSSTETAPENNNVSPQTNDENAEHSTETKPIENEVNAGVSDNVTNNPVSSHEKLPEGNVHHDNSVNAEPSPSPTTETNNDFNSEITNGNVLVDDSSAQDNEQTPGEEDGAPSADSDDHQIDHHTETPTETVSSTIGDSPSVNEHVNDVSTSSPQQQLADNNIPMQPTVVNPNEPIKTQEETKIPSGLPENNEPEKSPDSHVPTEISEIHDSDELSKPTELPTLNTGNGEQSVSTRIPEKNNENESATSHEPSLDENVNEILDQTTVYPANPSSDENNLNGAAGLNQNNQDNVTPLSDKVETSTNAQSSGDEPIKNINQDVPSENESSTLSQSEQVNQGSSENVDSVESSVTTNSYADVPSVVQSTNAPASQENNNKGSLEPIVQSDKIENNANNDQSENVKPQQNFESDDTSTEYNAVDSSTGIPIYESSSVNVNNNVEASTNAPVNPEIPNEINQDSVTESELYATESPTEKPILAVDSNKTPTNDATMEAISNLPEKPTESQTNTNEITNESTSKAPEDPNETFVTKPSDYVIDITASSSESPNKVIFESIKPEDHENEVTTSNIDKNDDATTELYENVQPGVPGEGSCLIDFVTYPHKANVPKSNPCHEKCECLNSIVTCTSVNCPPAPPQHRNCIPLHPGNESWCCPTYMCEGGIEGMIFENHNNDGAPQLISTVVLEDKPGEENNENTPINEEVPTTSSPQIALEYNTLAPSQDDTNSGTNSEDAIGVTEVPAQTEIPIKLIDDSVVSNGENIVPTTVANLETVEKEKPVEHDKPVESDKLTENDKPEESEQPSENETPVESDKPEGNEKPQDDVKPQDNVKPQDDVKPVESDQPTENEKPIDNSEADVTTVTYAADGQTVTNRPETSNNAEEQNVVLPNTVNESQDIAVPSTDIPNDYESTIASVIPANDQKRPEENADSDDTVAATTYKPEDSVIDQQVDDIKTNGAIQPTNNGEADMTNLPTSDVNPVEATEIPTIVADTKPTITGNNENGLRPTSIDDIINSVNMVKDAVKNSLETSSKPAEIDYQTTVGAVENYQPTEIVPEQPDSSPSSSENPLPVELPQQTTANGAALDVASELPTNAAVDEKLPESPVAATESAPSDDTAEVTVPNTSSQSQSDDTAGVTVPSTSNQSPSAADSDQQGAVQTTDIPLQVLDTQEIATGPGPVIANRPEEPIVDDGNRPEEPAVDDGSNRPEVTTAQYSPSAAIQDTTSGVPVPQSNAEQSTNVPGPVKVDDNDDDDKSPEISTALPAASAGPSFTDDTAPEKPDAETPVSADSDDADNKTPATQVAEHTTNDDKRFGVPSSSPAPSQINHGHGHDDNNNKRPQESEGMMHIPLDTETSSPKPSPIVNTPVAPYSTGRPSYTPIPQSTWTQKPFHQDSSSTSEAPQQPDQGFPDEYDDENEAVYGPGTCRYGGKIYVSAQQVPRDDPCDFCFCFRGDIICLQQSCPPPIFGCYQENIQGFCCPRYECPVAQATSVNVTTTTTTTTTMVPPHFFANAYRGAARRTGCLIHGHAYRVGEDVGIASGPCLECICGADGKMACDPKPCSPEPLLRKMMAEAVDQRRR